MWWATSQDPATAQSTFAEARSDNGYPRLSEKRVALVHDFFVQDAGAERCALELARLLPQADVYTSFFDESVFGDRLDAARVREWPVQRLIGRHRFRSLLPLYPLYFSTLDLRRYDLVVSSSVAFSKAVRTSSDALHLSYVYTPMRYAWNLDAYLGGSSYPAAAKLAARAIRGPLKEWDRLTSRRPDVVIAISETVRERIARHWGRSASVIHPPVGVSEFNVSERDDGFLLVAARLLAYRRLDLLVEAATRLARPLVVVGSGPERKRLESLAGPSIQFTGQLSRPDLVDLFERCHAYVLPGEEDFGIAPVEALASGKPVVAFARGGATETIRDGTDGVLFEEQSVEGLAAAIERLDSIAFDPAALRRRAEEFDTRHFVAAWRTLLQRHNVDSALYVGND
jgi:glycosyltransferase involved in cell wall biosynthesis